MDRQRARVFVLVVSIAFALIGGIGLLLTITVTSPVDTASVACGSALAPDDTSAKKAGQEADLEFIRAGGGLSLTRDSARDNVSACAEARSARATWTWPLLGLGAVGLLGSAFMGSSERDPKPQGETSRA